MRHFHITTNLNCACNCDLFAFFLFKCFCLFVCLFVYLLCCLTWCNYMQPCAWNFVWCVLFVTVLGSNAQLVNKHWFSLVKVKQCVFFLFRLNFILWVKWIELQSEVGLVVGSRCTAWPTPKTVLHFTTFWTALETTR